MTATHDRTVIAVTPAAERRNRARLFDSFELAYPVRFEGREAGAVTGAEAVVCLPGTTDEEIAGAPLPTLRYRHEETTGGPILEVWLADRPQLVDALRGARLRDGFIAGAHLDARDGMDVLAAADGHSVWQVSRSTDPTHHEVAVAPAELGGTDALRSRLAPGRNLAVLSLTHFIRELIAGRDWETPGTRAAFVLDDPNLRRPTYGHVNYAEMVASAAANNYHVSIAMVPLDGRAVHRDALRLFRDQTRHLSLCVHGNDHARHELYAPRTLAEGRVPAAQALRRSIRFERRTGLTMDRVMVAPHESLGKYGATGLLDCGFEGFSGTRPYPWLEYASDLSWLSRPADAGPLVGWGISEVVGGGLPALLRIDFNHPREELVIRAFLGQPIIMYGHDDLLRGGPGELERAAAEIGRLGEVQWQSLGGIARSSLMTRRRGAELRVRVLGRRVAFTVPEGVTELVVETDAVRTSSATRMRVSGPVQYDTGHEDVNGTRMTVQQPGKVEIRFDAELDPHLVPSPPLSVRARARRMVAEGRDRTRPKLIRALR